MKKLMQQQLKGYIGRHIYIVKEDGKRVEGKLIAIKDGQAYVKPIRKKGDKKVQTNFIFALWIIGILAFGLLFVCAFCGGRYGRGGCCGCGHSCGRGYHHGYGYPRYGRHRRFVRHRRRFIRHRGFITHRRGYAY